MHVAVAAKATKKRFLASDLALGGIMKVTALIFALLTIATVSGAAMVASVHEQPVLLACGGPNC
jgi:hypothetical protein